MKNLSRTRTDRDRSRKTAKVIPMSLQVVRNLDWSRTRSQKTTMGPPAVHHQAMQKLIRIRMDQDRSRDTAKAVPMNQANCQVAQNLYWTRTRGQKKTLDP